MKQEITQAKTDKHKKIIITMIYFQNYYYFTIIHSLESILKILHK